MVKTLLLLRGKFWNIQITNLEIKSFEIFELKQNVADFFSARIIKVKKKSGAF